MDNSLRVDKFDRFDDLLHEVASSLFIDATLNFSDELLDREPLQVLHDHPRGILIRAKVVNLDNVLTRLEKIQNVVFLSGLLLIVVAEPADAFRRTGFIVREP